MASKKKEPYVPYRVEHSQWKVCVRCNIQYHITHFRLNNHLNHYDYSREDNCHKCLPLIADEIYFKEREKYKLWLKSADGVAFTRKKGQLNAREYVIARSIATPVWVNFKKIKAIYDRCKEKSVNTSEMHHVDHIVPLRGKNVCGLHVHYNLQILTKKENLQKNNKFISL